LIRRKKQRKLASNPKEKKKIEAFTECFQQSSRMWAALWGCFAEVTGGFFSRSKSFPINILPLLAPPYSNTQNNAKKQSSLFIFQQWSSNNPETMQLWGHQHSPLGG